MERKDLTDTPDILEAGEFECFWDEIDKVIGIENFHDFMEAEKFVQRESKTKDEIS